METITLYSNQDLTDLVRSFDVEALSEPGDELTGKYEYIVSRAAFLNSYKNWNHDEHPLLQIHDDLSDTDIFLGRPSAQRVEQAIRSNQPTVQLS